MQVISKAYSVSTCIWQANEPAWNSADYDKLYSISCCAQMVSDSFAESYKSGQNQTINDGMIAFKGRLSYVQYLPTKPIKRGIKVWMPRDADIAYLHQFEGVSWWTAKPLAWDMMWWWSCVRICQEKKSCLLRQPVSSV